MEPITKKKFTKEQIEEIGPELYDKLTEFRNGDHLFYRQFCIHLIEGALVDLEYEWDNLRERVIRTYSLFDKFVEKIGSLIDQDGKNLPEEALEYLKSFYRIPQKARNTVGLYLMSCLRFKCADIILGNTIREALKNGAPNIQTLKQTQPNEITKCLKTAPKPHLNDAQKVAKTLLTVKSAKRDLREINFWTDKYNMQRKNETDGKAKPFGISSDASLCQIWLVVQKINHDVERVCGEGVEDLKPKVTYTNTIGEKQRVIDNWRKIAANPVVGKVIYNLLSNSV